MRVTATDQYDCFFEGGIVQFLLFMLAEECGSRTHQGRGTPLTGFEVRAPHQGAILFLLDRYP